MCEKNLLIRQTKANYVKENSGSIKEIEERKKRTVKISLLELFAVFFPRRE